MTKIIMKCKRKFGENKLRTKATITVFLIESFQYGNIFETQITITFTIIKS